jgi:ABC-2 type transport system ATP-binding protein
VDAIEIRRLTKSYGRARGIVDIDLSVPTGTVFGFLGPNGAGKTTLIRVLMDFLRPTRGTATLLGFDSRRDSVEVHRRVGYLAGEPGLYEHMTARELLDWLSQLRGRRDEARVDELCARVSVELDRPMRTLSKGNRQKVALVQAFMHRPELVILDEPTSGLDPLVQHEFQQLVGEVAAEGATVFLSSHVLDEVQHLCDHVAIIREGRLVAVDTIADLRERALREVVIRFARPVDPAPFARLPGVSGVRADGTTLRCRVAGETGDLVRLAASHDVVDFVSAPADLEDLFLHYYESKAADDGAAGH